ncbi:MAG: hypothetical protein RMK29_13405 [Myxococcales bacterium]|nr:hypothetical protein [Myxococcota bacterium]MDW8282704.1 hypothetical protein [Myxococcales bacterium]
MAMFSHRPVQTHRRAAEAAADLAPGPHPGEREAGTSLPGPTAADPAAGAALSHYAEAPVGRQTAQPSAPVGDLEHKPVQFIGTPLDKPLPPDAEKPAYGEDPGTQRRYSPEQYIAMWEKEQGRKMTQRERDTIDRGCIGITAVNLAGGGNPLDYAEGIYATFELAHAKMTEKNKQLDERGDTGPRYVLFAKLFWSNQSDKWEDRLSPDPKAFLPDPVTGEVDMSGYKYYPQSRYKTDPRTGERQKSSYINFDYGFWDEASQCFWHANHMQYKDPVRRAQDPMKVLQSTKEKFTRGYLDFDRIVFCIARAHNYDPGLAAIAHAGGGG